MMFSQKYSLEKRWNGRKNAFRVWTISIKIEKKKCWRVVQSKQMCHFKSCKVQKRSNLQQLNDVRCMQNCFRAANPPKQTTAGTFSGLAEIKHWDSHIHTRTNTSSYKQLVFISQVWWLESCIEPVKESSETKCVVKWDKMSLYMFFYYYYGLYLHNERVLYYIYI